MKLNYRSYGTGEPLIILHGLFGSSDNWQTLGKRFSDHYKVYLVDQRNHGKSPHSDAFNYDIMAEDLHELIEELGYDKVNLIGHSMGGKTVIAFAAEHPEMIKKMVVADIGYKAYPMHHDHILEGLHSLNLDEIDSRGEADEKLKETIKEWGVRQFLLKNLYWVKKGKLAWRMNLDVLSEKMENILAEVEFDKIEVDTLFIRGAKSNYILDSDIEDLKKKLPSSRIHSIEEAGHWVHAEAQDEFYQVVTDFLE
ncbi:MAG: alpha/beta fold hydrolase [Crocinitomicaceae bacterium]